MITGERKKIPGKARNKKEYINAARECVIKNHLGMPFKIPTENILLIDYIDRNLQHAHAQGNKTLCVGQELLQNTKAPIPPLKGALNFVALPVGNVRPSIANRL